VKTTVGETTIETFVPQSARVESLDALRLLAAVLVFFHHYLSIMGVAVPQWLSRGPLDSQAAVTLFFVLSGYVLAGSLSREVPSLASYIRFGVRRVLRLYPLYWCTLLMTLLIYAGILRSGGLDLNSEFIPGIFAAGELNSTQWLLHLSLLDVRIDHEFLVPPVWTLLVEARIAVIFPLMVWVLLRAPWKASLIFWLGLASSASWLEAHRLGILSTLGEFVAGILLAKVPAGFWKFNNKRWLLLLLASVACYNAIVFRFDAKWLARYTCATGAAGLVACSVYWQLFHDLLGRLQRVLRVDVSYGLYILHYPIIVGLLKFENAGSLSLNPVSVFVLSLAFTYLIAFVLHKAVEIPAIRLGRRLTRRDRYS
jgi:exopolysaccharide production protein ExoZ